MTSEIRESALDATNSSVRHEAGVVRDDAEASSAAQQGIGVHAVPDPALLPIQSECA